MSWKYLIGSSLAGLMQSVLAHKAMPLIREIPKGVCWPYDVKRFARLNIETIFDVGANTGQTCVPLAKFFPVASIYTFEPIISTYAKLVNNAKRYPNIKPYCLAFGSEVGKKVMHLAADSELNTLKDYSQDANFNHRGEEMIEMDSLDRFVAANDIAHIDLLKMDVQGYELEVLKGALNLLQSKRIHFVFTEVVFCRIETMCFFQDVADLLYSYEFEFCGFYDMLSYGKMKEHFLFCNALFMNKHSK